jgi:hypothetical protein
VRVSSPYWFRPGRSKVRKPPVLQCATLSCTSASSVFSISKPATLNSASLFWMITSFDCPT